MRRELEIVEVVQVMLLFCVEAVAKTHRVILPKLAGSVFDVSRPMFQFFQTKIIIYKIDDRRAFAPLDASKLQFFVSSKSKQDKFGKNWTKL